MKWLRHWCHVAPAGVVRQTRDRATTEVVCAARRSMSVSVIKCFLRSGLDRVGELARVGVPIQVIEAPEDPINPPPHAAHLSVTLGAARPTTITGIGHALNSRIIQPLVETILEFTGEVDKGEPVYERLAVSDWDLWLALISPSDPCVGAVLRRSHRRLSGGR